MSNNLIPEQQLYNTQQKEEINLQQIFQIISRRKKILVVSLSSFLLIALLYNMLYTPVFESFVTVKKEEPSDSHNVDEIKKIFSMQTTDNLNTEIEIVKSGTVLGRVVDELNLTFFVEEVKWNNGESEVLNASYTEYITYLSSEFENVHKLPHFHQINVEYSFPGAEVLIQKSAVDEFEIFLNGHKVLPVTLADNNFELKLPGLQIRFSWSNAAVEDKIYLRINNIEQATNKIRNSIRISAIGETNIAKLTVESERPLMAKVLANTIMDQYRNYRLENKRQNVLSSYEFVDNQLEGIREKLENAENELSNFKRNNQIAIMDESSKDIIESLSRLEEEKIKVELELGDYKNKRDGMNQELKEKGYFDQTHLSPQNRDGRGTPFSTLLEQLSDVEIQRLALMQRRKESHPDIIKINEQIAQIKSKLAEYNQNTLISYNIIIKGLRKKLAGLNSLISNYTQKIENLPGKNSELTQLTRNKNVYEKMFTLLLDKREEFRLAELSKMQDIVIVESAKIPHKPVRPKKILNIAIALALGLMIGFGTIFAKEIFERRITSLDETEKILPFPLLSIIPKYNKNLLEKIKNAEDYHSRHVTLMDDQSSFKESYRVLDLKIKNYSHNEIKTMIITSCEENTGKTSVTTNFAISLANRNKNVLLIDCDLRKANIASVLNKSNSNPGLINYLTDNIGYSSIINQLIIDKKKGKSLDFITSGGTIEHSSELLESDKMGLLIEELSSLYDYILIDTPPLTRIIDTLVLGRIVNDLILVIKPNHTHKDSIAIALEELHNSDINVIGYIVNAGDIQRLSRRYKYGYGYAYGYPVKK
jgi:capsular exopolysaccharide synthesis family protein